METCLFCKIVNGELPAKIIYDDGEIIAFDDIHPKAPCHKLIIPRQHIATLNDVEESEKELLVKMLLVARKIAKDLQIADKGYRVMLNCNPEGGQLIYHIHLHLLGGKALPLC
jgi:histidine triad (HIT) family protein